jgi:hypothetical protein
MSEEWYQKIGFETDPYYFTEPWVTPSEHIIWNRDDLQETKRKMNEFIEEVKREYNTSMLIYGSWRSGKSWLARYIKKEFEPNRNILFLTLIISEDDPTIKGFYQEFITRLIETDWLNKISSSIENPINFDSWRPLFDSPELSKIIHNIKTGNHKEISMDWLLGKKLTRPDMDKALVKTNLDDSYKKIETLKMIIKNIQKFYDGVIICVDQLEAGKGRGARFLSDLLRDIVSSFYEKLGLILITTMDNIDDWYTMGFTEPLLQRVKYKCSMDLINLEYLPTFLKIQQEIFRTKPWIKSQIYPFTDDSIKYLAKNMQSDKIFPQFMLFNCGIISKTFSKELLPKGSTEINSTIIDENLKYIDHRLERTGQTKLV